MIFMKKDIINLILYIIALCLTTIVFSFAVCYFLVIGLDLVTNPSTEAFLQKHHFVSGLILVFFLFCIITAFFFPVIVTKLFLDKNWSKYVTYFYDHMQYPTIVLIGYILIRQLLISSNLGIEENRFIFYNWWIYLVYSLALIRKFIKPIYKCFWILYFIFAIIAIAMHLNGFIL